MEQTGYISTAYNYAFQIGNTVYDGAMSLGKTVIDKAPNVYTNVVNVSGDSVNYLKSCVPPEVTNKISEFGNSVAPLFEGVPVGKYTLMGVSSIGGIYIGYNTYKNFKNMNVIQKIAVITLTTALFAYSGYEAFNLGVNKGLFS